MHRDTFITLYNPDALPRPPTNIPFTATPGVQTGLPCNATPLEYFQLFLTAHVLQHILQTTNDYAAARLSAIPPRRRSIFRNWRIITMAELKAFLGILIMMGIVQISNIKDYWSSHVALNLPFFRSIMSRDRFIHIFWVLHVGDRSGYSKRSKIQPFMDLVIPLFQQYLVPSLELSIDEATIAFRGRVVFRQYICGKPEPWGVKAYILTESTTGYNYVQCSHILRQGDRTSHVTRTDAHD